MLGDVPSRTDRVLAGDPAHQNGSAKWRPGAVLGPRDVLEEVLDCTPTFVRVGDVLDRAYTSLRAFGAIVTVVHTIRFRAGITALLLALFVFAQASMVANVCAFAMPDCQPCQSACATCDTISADGCRSTHMQTATTVTELKSAIALLALGVAVLVLPLGSPRPRHAGRLRTLRVPSLPAHLAFCRFLK